MKKVISLFLSLAMLLSIVSVVDFSAYASVKTGKCGDNVTYSLDTETGELTISGAGDMYNYGENYNSPFYYKKSIKTVFIKNGVTSIADFVFCGCTSLTSVTIPNSVTSIGDWAFYNCTNLTSVTIPDSVTSIGNGAFDSCTSLTSVTIPDSVTSIGSFVFQKCTWLTSVTIPDSVTSIGNGAFFCTSLTEITIPNSVTSIGADAFRGCTSLTSIKIPNSVTSIGVRAFSNCRSLTSVTIPDSVTSIGENAFYGCTNLTSVIIPDSVTSIGSYAFKDCTSLTSITIPNSVESIGDNAFSGCSKLKKIEIPDSVISIGDEAFSGCTSLESVTIGNKVISIGDYAFRDCKKLESVTIGNNVTSIGSDAFYNTAYYNDKSNWNNGVLYISNCLIDTNNNFKSTTDYTIEDGTRIIADSAFDGCTSLTSVTIPNSVTRIDNKAFYNCTSLTSVTIPNSVTSIGYSAFEDCKSLTSVNYSGTKSQWKSIKFGSNNDKLKNAIIICTDDVIGNGNTVTIDNLKYKINNDYTASLVGYTGEFENLTIPESVTYEGYTFSVTSIGDYAFRSCENLTSVTIPDSVKSIGNDAFFDCTSLTSVNYGGTKSQWKSIKFGSNNDKLKNAIIICTDDVIGNGNTVTIDNLKYKINNDYTASLVGYTGEFENLTIPESVTYEGYTFSVTSIGDYAFRSCENLTSVTIPDSVKSIGNDAFFDCTSLTSVNYGGTKSQWKAITIGSDNYYLTHAFIKCTDGIIGNGNTVTVDSVKYRLNDDTAQVISYSGTPENITISECVSYESYTFKVTSIGSSAFSGCTSLASVTIPNSVTTIGCDAFNGCSKLKKIEIPDSVTYIGSKAFDGTAFYNTVKNWKDGVLYCGNHLISAKSDVTKITVKASTVSIAAGALDNCKSLKKINVLNPKCVINCTIPKTAVIGGAEGSTAEDFAQKNNMSIDYFEECTHSDKVQVVIAATCTEQGAVQSRCADCDKLISQTFTAPLGHTMVITTPAKAPTCTTSGNTQAGYCTVCGYNEVSTVIPATGHNFGNNSPNCLVCGAANPNYVAPTQPNQNDTNTSNDEDVTVTSKPKSASIKKVKGAKKAILVTWKKVSGVNGYEIQVATNKKFKKNKKTVNIKKQKTTKTTVKKLKAKKKYYVRVRTYKIVNGKKVYSSWSKVKTVKTK